MRAIPRSPLAGVIGIADSLRTEAVTAFVVRGDGGGAEETLSEALRTRVRDRIGAHAVPRSIRYLESLPLTATGKVMRRKLRELVEN